MRLIAGGCTLLGFRKATSALLYPRFQLSTIRSTFGGAMNASPSVSGTENEADESSIRIGIVQPRLRADDEHPLKHTEHVIDLMKKQYRVTPDVSVFVLPEFCPLGYSEHTFSAYLNSTGISVQSDIDGMLRSASAAMDNVLISYGCPGVRDDGSRTIRQIVVGGDSGIICAYDKMFICNYGDCAESRFFQPGDEVKSFSCGEFEIGILICADMRVPTLARRLAVDRKVDVIIHPSAFSRDLSFFSWKSFRETRAVENSVYWLAANYAGDYFGESSVQPPWIDENHLPKVMGTEEGCLIATISRATLDHARTSMPYYEQLLKEKKT